MISVIKDKDSSSSSTSSSILIISDDDDTNSKNYIEMLFTNDNKGNRNDCDDNVVNNNNNNNDTFDDESLLIDTGVHILGLKSSPSPSKLSPSLTVFRSKRNMDYYLKKTNNNNKNKKKQLRSYLNIDDSFYNDNDEKDTKPQQLQTKGETECFYYLFYYIFVS